MLIGLDRTVGDVSVDDDDDGGDGDGDGDEGAVDKGVA